MKRLIIGGLSFLLFVGGNAPMVEAETVTTNPYVVGNHPSYNSQIAPVDLAEQAYRGYFIDQGIHNTGSTRLWYEMGILATGGSILILKRPLRPNRITDFSNACCMISSLFN